MEIAGSDILLSSQHASVVQHTMRESLRAWTGPERPDFEGRGQVAGRAEMDRVSISGEGKAAQESDAGSAPAKPWIPTRACRSSSAWWKR